MTLACILVLVSIVLVIMMNGRRSSAMRLRDGTNIRQIHQATAVLAAEMGSRPSPGFMKRLPAPGIDRPVPGVGPEDTSQNTTANFCSMLIAQNYITPEICIGPSEPSGRVVICDRYDWEAYLPEVGIYWDPAFKADLAGISNNSYAHLPMFPGAARIRHWGPAGDATIPMIGNRGPRDGDDPKSITLRIHEPVDRWDGYVCYRDNHVAFIETFTPHGTDNIFAYDDGIDGDDAIISFVRTMNEDGPTLQFD